MAASLAREQGLATDATDRDSALLRYALLREAQAQLDHLRTDFLDSAAARDAARLRALRTLPDDVQRAADAVPLLCAGNAPQDCVAQTAAQTASGIEDESTRAWAFRAIATAYAEAGLLAQALHAAPGIEHPTERASALAAIMPYF